MKLVEDARDWWRWWSVHFNTVGLAILAWMQIDPVSVLYVWNMMPASVRRVVPEYVLIPIAMALFALSMLSRVLRQSKLEKRDASV